MPRPDCLLCNPAAADREFSRVRLWEDDLWRLAEHVAGADRARLLLSTSC